MAGKGANSWKKFKTKQKKQKSLLKKRENQRCPGCLNKSCPKKFNNDEDKCGCPGCLNKSCPKKFNNDEDKCGES